MSTTTTPAHPEPVEGSVAERFRFTARAEPVNVGDVYGYAWRHPNARATLVLVHGLQSHALWFAEAAELLLDRGFSVYALDRRGSGSSPGPRGHVDAYGLWFDEVGQMVQLARTEHPDVPSHLVGHCFGANVALGAILRKRAEVQSLIMLTPGLAVLPGYRLAEKLRIAGASVASPRTTFRVPQDVELFSRDPDVLAWIAADRDGARSVTARCLVQINRMVGELRAKLSELDRPLLVFEASRDRISDNRTNRRLLEQALGTRCQWAPFDAEHFLLAEPCRDEVIDKLVTWTEDQEAT